MFTRSTIAPVLASALAACWVFSGCGDTASDLASGGSIDDVANATLTVVGATSIEVAPRGAAELRVLYRGADFDGDGEPDMRAGVTVEFVLVGDAAAISLSPAQAVTDENGEAVAQLTAGSDAAKFRVRASTEGAEPAIIDVEVKKSAIRRADVSASYAGLRSLATRTITALPGLGCEAAFDLLSTNMKGEVTQTYNDPEGSVLFKLGPGLHYALLAWGTDARGGILADGCSEIDVPVDAPVDGDAALEGVIIELFDRPLSLAGSYAVTLELDVARSAQRAGETLVAGGQALLTSPTSPGAEYFLDAIEDGIRGAGKDASALVAARASGSLDASLQADLSAANVGPLPWLSKLGSELQDRGSRLVLKASYGVTSIAGVPMSLTLNGMESRSADASRTLSYPPMLLPVTLIDAQYDDARAVIAVDTIRVQLPLGTYSGRLLDAIDAIETGGVLGLLASQTGCGQLAVWAAKQTTITAVCDATCVAAACNSAIGVLLSKARTKLTTLDADHPSIGVRGELLVSDTNNDAVVDELGTAAFAGSWGKAPKAEQADSVDADFSVTSSIPAL